MSDKPKDGSPSDKPNGGGSPPKDQGYTDFGHYWHLKQDKLRAQTALQNPRQSDIFAGVCIYVNGLTDPPQNALRDLIVAHGGAHQYVLVRHLVTHVVATVLPAAKIRQLGERDIIVRPEWITESIAAGKRLPIEPYRLYSQMDPLQGSISQWTRKSPDLEAAVTADPTIEPEDATLSDDEVDAEMMDEEVETEDEDIVGDEPTDDGGQEEICEPQMSRRRPIDT